MPDGPAPHYSGHRDRLRKRFIDAGGNALGDYELLEMLLFYTFPRGDTKPLAKDLIAQLGSLQAVFGSPLESLKCVKGVGPSTALFLKLIHVILLRIMKDTLMGKVVLQSWQQVVDYCQVAMAYLKEEQLRLLFLDQKNQLILDEIQSEGTINHTAIYPRKVIKRALELGASSLIMVHNHPSGDPTPSREDINITLKIKEAGLVMDIELHDHIIVGQGEYRSFKRMGFL
jgi:DNA repair protein RadC